MPENDLIQDRQPYCSVAKIMESAIRSHSPPISSGNIKELSDKIHSCDPQINYDRLAYPFALKYWPRNFWKAVYFFEYGQDATFTEEINSAATFPQILVLGAGSAADTVACMTWLDYHCSRDRNISITLIDRSQKQLELAKNLIEKVKGFWKKTDFDIRYEHADALTWNPQPDSTDLVMMSHFLTENPLNVDHTLEKVISSLRGGGRIITIERERDPIWQRARDYFTHGGIPVTDIEVHKDDVFSLLGSIKGKGLDLLTITPHYVFARLPHAKYQMELVAKYLKAWQQQSLGLVDEIFTKDATYHEKPLTDPQFQGKDAIMDYWKTNPIQQRNIRIEPKSIVYEAGLILCEFGGDFDTPKQHIAIQGAMVFEIDSRARQIKAFREYFNTSKSPF